MRRSRVVRACVRAGSVASLAGLVHGAINAGLLRRPPATAPVAADLDAAARVAVLVPARNEAARIAACLRSIGRPALVLDDESVDATAEVARTSGAQVVSGVPRPPGWLGKPWACAQLAATAPARRAEVLVLLDADVVLAAGAVERALALLDESGLDVICPFPRQLAHGAGERLLQPLLQWSWLTTLPLRLAERSPRPSLTAACGQFMLIRRAALDKAGGFAAVRADVLDDLALVRAVKAAGGRGGVVDGTDLATCRMYDGFGELRRGYGKSLWSAFGSPSRAALVVMGLGVVYVLPPLAALTGSRAGALGYAGAVASRLLAARRTGARMVPDAFAHPVSVLALDALILESLWRRRYGTLRWKGRRVTWD